MPFPVLRRLVPPLLLRLERLSRGKSNDPKLEVLPQHSFSLHLKLILHPCVPHSLRSNMSTYVLLTFITGRLLRPTHSLHDTLAA